MPKLNYDESRKLYDLGIVTALKFRTRSAVQFLNWTKFDYCVNVMLE